MKLTRRKFLFATGITASALTIGFVFRDRPAIPGTVEGSFQPNAWLQITKDGRYIFELDKSEMGQGVMTTLPTILAEELDLEPSRLEVRMAGVHDAFNNTAMGVQITGGSTSVPTTWDPLREAGATARAWLMAAAAKQLSVNITSLRTDNGEVISGNKRIAYHDLLESVQLVSAPKDVALKAREQYKWLGKPMPRRDSYIKSTGKAMFGIDTRFENMLTAVVVRPPYFGGSVKSFDKSSVAGQKGVKHVFEIHSGIAIVAETYWLARKAANQLKVEWDKGPLEGLNNEKIREAQKQAIKEKGYAIVGEGDFEAAITAAENNDNATIVEAAYDIPFAHHSPLEPENCVAIIDNGKAEIWAPTQTQDIAQQVFAYYTGLERPNITVNTTLLGGGFGRRGYTDFVGEVAAIAKKIPGTHIKLQWSREDDMQHDYYRPQGYQEFKAVIENGKAVAWQQNYVTPSVLTGFGVELMGSILPDWVPMQIGRGIGVQLEKYAAAYDPSTAEGAKIPYGIENKSVNFMHHDSGVPIGFWRSVAHSHHGFTVESFMDELAVAAKKDPVEFRREILQGDDIRQKRYLGVLDLVAEKSNWGKTNRHQGISIHESFGSFVGMVAEVSVKEKEFTVDKIICSVDCGVLLNPAIVKAQIQGAAIYGLTAALKDPVRIEDGKVAQSNFHDMPVLRMNETPEFEVYFVESNEHPGGVGEIGTPPVASAVANALFKATGQRLRTMPFKLS